MEKVILEASSILLKFASDYLIFMMLGVFLLALAVKFTLYYCSKGIHRFCVEFEKRIHRHLEGSYPETQEKGFVELTKLLLEKTYHEAYILRATRAKRSLDKTTSLTDRVLLLEEGIRKVIFDTLKHVRYHKKDDNPDFTNLVRFVFTNNIYINKLLGIIPINTLNNLLGILPGLFIIGGIFGTFLGITSGIPELKNIDPGNIELAKLTMSDFLDKMSFSMNTSLFGIIFSVAFTIINSLFSDSHLRDDSLEKFFHTLEFIWKDTRDHEGEDINIHFEKVLSAPYDTYASKEESQNGEANEASDDEDAA